MADGVGPAETDIELAFESERISLFTRTVGWFFGTRSGLLTMWAIAAFLSFVAVMLYHIFATPILNEPMAKAGFIGAGTLFWLPLILLFLDTSDNLTSGPKFSLPAICLALLVALTTFAISDRILHLDVLNPSGTPTDEHFVYRLVFAAYLIAAFIPLIWNANNFAKHELLVTNATMAESSTEDSLAVTDDADAEAMGALIATTIVLLIGGLAFIAGEMSDNLSFPNGFGLVLCSAVIGVFAVVIFMETIADWPPVRLIARLFRGIARVLHPLAAFYEWVDSGLVRIGSGVAGMRHHRTASRYTLLAGTLLCLALLGWWLPAPLGLIPVLTAFVIALSVSRLWSWVEDDRALAAMTEYREKAPYRIGFREDFRDETLLGFAFVFILVPIAMMQAHTGNIFGAELFANADGKNFLDWIGYFGVELAKAVPIVDWAEIYNVAPNDDLIQMNKTPSRHSVFLARVMVDLVLIAALLQAIGISTRNRQQKRLYAAGHVARLDQFVERIEFSRAIRAAHLTAKGVPSSGLDAKIAATYFDLAKPKKIGLIDFRIYDEDRLRHLFWSNKSKLTRAFIQAISHERGMPLSTAIDLTKEIADSHRNELDLFRAYERATQEHASKRSLMDAQDIYAILSSLRKTSGLKDFKFRLIDDMSKIGSADTVLDLLAGLAIGDKADTYLYTRNHAANTMAKVADMVSAPNILETIGTAVKQDRSHERTPGKAQYNSLIKKLRERYRIANMELNFPMKPRHE